MTVNFGSILLLITLVMGLICLYDVIVSFRKRDNQSAPAHWSVQQSYAWFPFFIIFCIIYFYSANFELILFYATVVTGIFYLLDQFWLSKVRGKNAPLPIWIDYARSFFPILLIVFLLRSFLFEPFRIPSPSLEPTLLTGDFILVNKFAYGLRLPVTHNNLIKIGAPARGDIMVFRWPPNPSVYFIKRVIGLPGDTIDYVNKTLTVNGQVIPQAFVRNTIAYDVSGEKMPVTEKQENLLGVHHDIYLNADRTSHDYTHIVVPPGMYFLMGDNRDDSADSRYWGFVPDKNVVGKASLVWMSWRNSAEMADKPSPQRYLDRIRFSRIGTLIH